MSRSPVVGNLFSGRSDLPVAMFIGHALAKRCVPHPVNPENPASEQLIAIRLQTTCLGLRREVAFAFRRCSASRERGNVPKFPELASESGAGRERIMRRLLPGA